MSDMSIKLRKNDKKGKQILLCRKYFNKYEAIPKGAHYVSINGYASGGSASLCMCLEHAEEFFKEVTKVKREIKKIK